MQTVDSFMIRRCCYTWGDIVLKKQHKGQIAPIAGGKQGSMRMSLGADNESDGQWQWSEAAWQVSQQHYTGNIPNYWMAAQQQRPNAG
jgi:hypothetical protein